MFRNFLIRNGRATQSFLGKNSMKNNSTPVVMLSVLLLTLTLTSTTIPAYSNTPQTHSRAAKGLDDMFDDVATSVPGFGGMYLDGNTLKVYLTDPAQKVMAEHAIGAVFGAARIPAGGVQTLKGTYGFHQLHAWYNHIGAVFNIQGVVYKYIDENANILTVAVENQGLVASVQTEVSTTGVPQSAVNIVTADPIYTQVTLQDQVRPIQGGLQIQFSNFLCSISYNAVRGGVAGFVTASHCTDIQGGVEGTLYYQPLTASNTFIGTEIADPTYTKATCTAAGVKGNHVCRYSDTSFEQLASGVQQTVGAIEQTDTVNTGSLTIAGNFRVVSEGPSLVGQTVNKVGRTTGWSQGQVTNTCVNTGVSGSKIVQLCQDWVSATVGPGDSGSGVFAITSGSDVQLRGTLWGGNGAGTIFVYSPIANIQRSDELGPISTCASGFTC